MKSEARNSKFETNIQLKADQSLAENFQNTKLKTFWSLKILYLDIVSDFDIRISNLRMRGFTLIELVVYMGIFAILLGILVGVFTSIVNTQLSSESVSSAD